jgi:hypothetical protein
MSGDSQYSAVQTSRDFQYTTMVSSSKKGLKSSDISVTYESEEFAEKTSIFDERELLGSDESSDSDFCDQEDDMLCCYVTVMKLVVLRVFV